MEKRYRVTLTEEERDDLRKLVSVGKAAAQKAGSSANSAVGGSGGRRFVEVRPGDRGGVGLRSGQRRTGSQAVRRRRPGSGAEAQAEPHGSMKRKMDGKAEAHLIALACGAPPEGRSRWTLRLLGDQMVALEHVESVSSRDGSSGAKKNELKPWLKKGWCLPEGPSAEFVAAMEDVLEVYHRPYDAQRPVVCMDECSKQLIGEVREPLPPKPGHVAKQDSEYERRGTANVFMAVEPLAGQAHDAGDRTSHARGLGSVRADAAADGVPGGGEGGAGDGQPQHARHRQPVRGVRPRSRLRSGGTLGDPLHAQAWKLAEHGGDGTERSVASMPGSAHRRPRPDGPRNRRLGTAPQRRRGTHQLAVHDRRCPNQAETTLSIIRRVTEH